MSRKLCDRIHEPRVTAHCPSNVLWRLTDKNPSQQGYAQRDTEGNGLSDALGGGAELPTRHFREHIFHTETQMTRTQVSWAITTEPRWVIITVFCVSLHPVLTPPHKPLWLPQQQSLLPQLRPGRRACRAGCEPRRCLGSSAFSPRWAAKRKRRCFCEAVMCPTRRGEEHY